MTMINKKGVDISSNNGSISLRKVKEAGYDFVMIRCGYGSNIASQDDTQFEANVKHAEQNNMPWGAYLYSYALNTDQAKSEVEHIKRLLKGKYPTMPVAIDMEDADGYHAKHGAWNFKTINSVTKTLLEGLKAAGFYPMLYTGFEELNNLISKEVANSVDIWFAQWWKTCDYKGKNLGMWQYGGETNYIDGNSIPGVGVIDKDLCYKDYPTIIRNGGYNGFKKPEPKVLDKYGFTKGNASDGVLTLKELLILAKKKGMITQGVDENNIFGDGTEKAVNQVLKLGGYAQNGIAGEGFIKFISKKL